VEAPLSTHVNPPWKSFVLFLVLVGLGWAAYEFLYVQRVLGGGSVGDTLTTDQRDALRERIETQFEQDRCFQGVRGHINWRPRDDFYRIEIIVNQGCEDRARYLCREIADLVERTHQVPCSVWAFDDAGRQLAQHVN
jgi:hypothetical protein